VKKLKSDIAKSKIEAKALPTFAGYSKGGDEDGTGGSKRKAEENTDYGAKKMKSSPTKEVLQLEEFPGAKGEKNDSN